MESNLVLKAGCELHEGFLHVFVGVGALSGIELSQRTLGPTEEAKTM